MLKGIFFLIFITRKVSSNKHLSSKRAVSSNNRLSSERAVSVNRRIPSKRTVAPKRGFPLKGRFLLQVERADAASGPFLFTKHGRAGLATVFWGEANEPFAERGTGWA